VYNSLEKKVTQHLAIEVAVSNINMSVTINMVQSDPICHQPIIWRMALNNNDSNLKAKSHQKTILAKYV